jgi:hypothetical protein
MAVSAQILFSSDAFHTDNKKPISGVTGDGFFGNSSDLNEQYGPEALSLLEVPPPDFADDLAHAGREYRRRFLIASRLSTV